MTEDLLWLPAALIGLVAGSFINVVAYRIPLGRSVVQPRSACPACDHALAWQDNIPVVSWLLLRGRCRHCAERISLRYPVIELATAVLFGATAAAVGWQWVLPAFLWFAGVAVTLTVTDLDHRLIPNRILFPSTVVALGLLTAGALLDGEPWQLGRAVLGGGVYFAVFLVIALVARGGFGFGDVKLAAFLGLYCAYLGWDRLVVAMLLPFIIGGIISILLLVTRIKGRKDAIPFGPYMVIGAFAAVLFGEAVIDWYLR